jgi:DNA-3-methyladenine glycosylase II
MGKAENPSRPDGSRRGASIGLAPIRRKADIARGLDHLVDADPALAAALAVAGEVPLRLAQPGFGGLVSIVISQQVSVASADAIEARLRALVDPLDAASLLALGEAGMRKAGLSGPKQRALAAIGEAVLEGRLDLDAVPAMAVDDAIAHLTAIKGIGPWTAEIYLLFCAGHPDIFPAGDLALQEAARLALNLRKRPPEARLRQLAKRWSPWRGVAARLLWAYYREARQRERAARR